MAHRSRFDGRQWIVFGIAGLLSACSSSDQATSACAVPARPITEGPCSLRSASVAHVEQSLGLSGLQPPNVPNTSAGVTSCAFCGEGSPIIQFIAVEVPSQFSAYRINLEAGASATSEDYPGFGDEAFVLPLSNAKGTFVENCLAVRQGTWGVLVCAIGVEVTRMQTLETDLLAELGS